MDSRVEELAEIIIERCEGVYSKFDNSSGIPLAPNEKYKYRMYNRISYLAQEMLEAVKDYRDVYPEEYK